MFLEPDASTLSPEMSGPIVPSSPYVYGWLLAGVDQPYGSGLMIGLGSGAGVIALLSNFVNFDLTVVEVDPVMVEVALRNFPLLDYYLNQGRLNIVIADANEYLKTSDHFQVGFADAYDGGGSFKLIDSYIPALCQKCDAVILNVIDSPVAQHLAAVAAVCEENGHPIQMVMRASAPETIGREMPKANYIMTSQALSLQDIDAFIPFANLTEPAAEYGRTCWNMMISSALQVGS
jgi:precorrin-6B methylase 2